MAGVPIPVSEIDTNTFRVRPSGRKDGDLRVLFVHGGGASDSMRDRSKAWGAKISWHAHVCWGFRVYFFGTVVKYNVGRRGTLALREKIHVVRPVLLVSYRVFKLGKII